MKILYNYSEVHKAIKSIFKIPCDRRVAVVAYLGINADCYLPTPEGIQIICSPEPGATSPDGIRKLLKRKASIQFSEGLHSKVYWSTRGCVITSANISDRALGCHPQQEVGILIDSNEFDIDRLITEASPTEITSSLMDELSQQDRRLRKFHKTKTKDKNKKQFTEWYESPYREPWKIGWWSGSELEVSESAINVCQKDYNTEEPKKCISFAKNQVNEDNWLLTFEITENKIQKIAWMYIDFIEKINSTDKITYGKDYPYLAVQVHKSTHYPQSPFHISRKFINAFKKATKSYGIVKIENSYNCTPTKKMLDLTYGFLRIS